MGYIVAIAVYLAAIMVYGLVLAHKKVKTTDDMMTGGHRIPFIILVGSLLATWCGGGGITGSAGVVYSGGPWVGAITFAAPPIGIILLYFIAGKVRKSNKVTVPEIMGARYGKSASIISALLMIGGFFVAIPLLISAANAQGVSLPEAKTTITGGMTGIQLLGYFLPSLALMLGDQNMLQRFASAKDSNEAKKSNIGMFIGEVAVIVAIIAFCTQSAKLYPNLDTPSNVIFQTAVDYLPFLFGALVMCACMGCAFFIPCEIVQHENPGSSRLIEKAKRQHWA